jgi:hypothetical protein
MYLQAESASASVTPIAAGASAGASRSKRGRKKVQRFEPEGKVQADYHSRSRIRKLQDAKFTYSKTKR